MLKHTAENVLQELRARFPELDGNQTLSGPEAVNRLTDWAAKLAAESVRGVSAQSDGACEEVREACIASAREIYADDEISIDDDARLSVGGDVVHVQAWVALVGDDRPACMREWDGAIL